MENTNEKQRSLAPILVPEKIKDAMKVAAAKLKKTLADLTGEILLVWLDSDGGKNR